MTYLCIRVSLKHERRSKRFFKKFLKKKIFRKFGGFKNMTYLCTTFRFEIMKQK